MTITLLLGLAGIGAAWDALGGAQVPNGMQDWALEDLSTPRGTWYSQAYQFINNIGQGAANASIAGSSTGALASGIGSGGLASLGSQELTGLNMNLFPRSSSLEMSAPQSGPVVA